jgi:hypothetical protein
MPAVQFTEFGRGQPATNRRAAGYAASTTTTLRLAVLIENRTDETEHIWVLSHIVAEH